MTLTHSDIEQISGGVRWSIELKSTTTTTTIIIIIIIIIIITTTSENKVSQKIVECQKAITQKT